MSDGLMFFLFLLGVFALGIVAGVISALCLIRWAIRDPLKEQLRQEREAMNDR